MAFKYPRSLSTKGFHRGRRTVEVASSRSKHQQRRSTLRCRREQVVYIQFRANGIGRRRDHPSAHDARRSKAFDGLSRSDRATLREQLELSSRRGSRTHEWCGSPGTTHWLGWQGDRRIGGSGLGGHLTSRPSPVQRWLLGPTPESQTPMAISKSSSARKNHHRNDRSSASGQRRRCTGVDASRPEQNDGTTARKSPVVGKVAAMEVAPVLSSINSSAIATDSVVAAGRPPPRRRRTRHQYRTISDAGALSMVTK